MGSEIPGWCARERSMGGDGRRLRRARRTRLVIETRAPPKGTRFFSIVACACSRGGRVMRARAGWPVNSANARMGEDGEMVVVATRSAAAFRTVTRAAEKLDGDASAVNAQRMFDEVRSLDVLSLSMRVAYWPDASAREGDGDALGEYQKLEWPAFITRRNGAVARRGADRLP